uniref:Alcohol dehydrogenase 5-like n=1 Tax=Salmo trutta TaxID=8032 RepID=A0A674AME3_SALTR
SEIQGLHTSLSVIKCKAAVAWEHGKLLSIEKVEVAPPKAHEVQIASSGMCHTDWGYLYETGVRMHLRLFPLFLGHKGSGVVEGVGPGVFKFSPGTVVTPLALRCSALDRCATWEPKAKGGYFEEYKIFFICLTLFWLLHDSIRCVQTFDWYCMYFQFCFVLSAVLCLNRLKCDGCQDNYKGFHNPLRVEPGSTCVVCGLGAVGLATVMAAKLPGLPESSQVDINPGKFDKAEAFGATEFVNSKDHSKPIQEVLVEMTGGGVDFDFFKKKSFQMSCLERCKDAWSVCVVGWTEVGKYFGGWKSVESVPKLVGDYMNKKLKLDECVTHTLTLDQINEALDLLNGGKIRTSYQRSSMVVVL